MSRASRGFTLVEMVVVAPIVILAIGAFIALIVNLTGEVLSSRGSNTLTYNIQDALNRIEADVKLSATTLATNSISVASTNQGYVADGQATPNGSTVNFTNIDKTGSGGSPASLILNSFVTNGNPLSDTTTLLYLKDTPNDCSDVNLYSKNTPLTINIIYYITNNTLWRRTIMPSNYATASNFCGGTSWQRPSCLPGYTVAFCKTNDEKLIEGVSPGDFSVGYYTSADATSPIAAATNSGASDAARNTALNGASTLKISITAKQTIAGRDITRTGAVQVTRLDTNASAIAPDSTPTAPPSVMPIVSSTVYDGHKVRFTWNQVPTATSYDVSYTVNGGAATTASVDNSNRKLEVTNATHTDTVAVTVKPRNIAGVAATGGTNSTVVPLWAPLLLKGSWSDCGSDTTTACVNLYTTAAYTKTKTGVVLLKGVLRNFSSPATEAVIGTLPADYVPAGGRLTFSTLGAPGNTPAPGRVDVLTNGEVHYISGDARVFPLDPIHYISADATYTRTPPTLQNGFSNFNNGYAPASYVQDSTGRVSVQGYLNQGTITSQTVIFALPANLQPSLEQAFPSHANNFHNFGIAQSSRGGGVVAKGVSSNPFSINAMYFPSSYGGWSNLTLQNGWTTYSATTFSTPQYTKTSDNIVNLKGVLTPGTTALETPITTLPAGFRPAKRMIFSVVNLDSFARFDVTPSGEVRILSTGNTNRYSLDSIMFVAEQ